MYRCQAAQPIQQIGSNNASHREMVFSILNVDDDGTVNTTNQLSKPFCIELQTAKALCK